VQVLYLCYTDMVTPGIGLTEQNQKGEVRHSHSGGPRTTPQMSVASSTDTYWFRGTASRNVLLNFNQSITMIDLQGKEDAI
jgi:hypothetical protein